MPRSPMEGEAGSVRGGSGKMGSLCWAGAQSSWPRTR